MTLIKLYKKSLIIKYTYNTVYKFYLLYNKNLFITYKDIYRHQVWNYKNVAKGK